MTNQAHTRYRDLNYVVFGVIGGILGQTLYDFLKYEFIFNNPQVVGTSAEAGIIIDSGLITAAILWVYYTFIRDRWGRKVVAA